MEPSPRTQRTIELARTEWPTVREFLGCGCTDPEPETCTGSPVDTPGEAPCGPAPTRRHCSCHYIRTKAEHQEIRAAVEARRVALDRTLHYVDDVTAADVEAIEAFLDPRLAEQRDEHYGTAAYKLALALDSLVRDAAHSARWQLQRLAEDDFRDGMDRLVCRQDLQRAWNRLWHAVVPWQNEQGYDSARWHHVGYLDPRDRVQQEEMTAVVEAELAAEDAAAAGQDSQHGK